MTEFKAVNYEGLGKVTPTLIVGLYIVAPSRWHAAWYVLQAFLQQGACTAIWRSWQEHQQHPTEEWRAIQIRVERPTERLTGAGR